MCVHADCGLIAAIMLARSLILEVTMTSLPCRCGLCNHGAASKGESDDYGHVMDADGRSEVPRYINEAVRREASVIHGSSQGTRPLRSSSSVKRIINMLSTRLMV